MSGHSKWATIKRKKAGVDAARGKVFTKLIKEITVAAKMGGSGDVNANPRLRLAVDKAKSNSMPKDTIERAIARGTGEVGGENFENLTYEGYGPGGIAIIVNCLTDNRARTAAEVRNAFNKGGGTMGTAGSVSYMFQTKGVFTLPKDGLDEDTVTMAALDGGADDVQGDEESWTVTCSFEGFDACRKALEQLGVEVNGGVQQIADNLVPVSGDDAVKLMKLIERIEDCDDVQETFTNADIDEEALAAME